MVGSDGSTGAGKAFAGALVGATLLALAPVAGAATYAPNTRGDHAPNGCTRQDCTVRESVIKANNHKGRDTIVLGSGKTYNLRRTGTTEDAAATGDLDINDPLTIKSSRRRRATVDANDIDRVFDVGVLEPANTTFKRLKIRGGDVNYGGGIQQTNGSVKLNRSLVTGNVASNNGGGVNAGSDALTVVKSTISSGRAGSLGGGLHLRGDVVAKVRDSTINENSAGGFGGGIHLEVSATITITNSTIANNAAGVRGGGVHSEVVGGAELRSVTVARNLAADSMGNGGLGGGLYSNGGFTLRNSLVAKNRVGVGGSGPDCYGAYVPGGVSLLTDLSDCTGPSDAHDIVTSRPRIAFLAKNGGPTQTIALNPGSPAINAAGSGSPSRDQRGETRNNPDIGAFERKPRD